MPGVIPRLKASQVEGNPKTLVQWSAALDVRTVQLWLGHSDLETTSCYLKAISGKQKGVREKVDATFAEIAVQPMRQSEVATIQ
jgi:hypothetical protein